MAVRKRYTPQEMYQLKVTLLGAKPPIWRRLLVSADLTLEELHVVLETTMGWGGGHLHEFIAGDRHFGQPDLTDGFADLPPVESERRVRLSAVLGGTGTRMTYVYDFGDNWEHSIVLEKRGPAKPAFPRFFCIDGELACPPEDCGGIPGYYDLLEALADPNHEEHAAMRAWVGCHFDPQAFSADEVNRVLLPAPRHRKKPAH